MPISTWLKRGRFAVIMAALCLAMGGPSRALEKQGMPDLSQVDETCLPTSTANLILWFGKHGYPKMIMAGDTDEDRTNHTLHTIMADTDARFDWGTRMDMVTVGIKKYITDAGYNCDVEYRGLEGKTPFTPDWLNENDESNKGFILLLAYCHYNEGTQTFSNAWNAGHAVTLVNIEPDMLLVHDPAHDDDETGRKILTPQVLTYGTWRDERENVPVSGLMLLSGSLLEAPPDAGVMLVGAVCITMRPDGLPTMVASSGAPNGTIAGTAPGDASSTPAAPAAAPAAESKSWVMLLFDYLFEK
jgi:hypothetical protein